MESLRGILRRARSGLEQGWLFLPESRAWSLDTQAQIIDIDELPPSEVDKDGMPVFASKNSLSITLESAAIEDIAAYAENLENPPSDELLLESFIYYFEHDAFLPEPGYQPPSTEDSMTSLDRKFYEVLGAERENVPCNNKSCTRGAIANSVYCRVHHFEMIQKKPCPFTD